MVNIWNAYQCMVTFNLSRSASLFESGIGRGMGFRDSNQDLLGFVHMVPERARERILDIAATQLPTGGAYHQYQPLTKRGNDAIGSRLQRRPAWLVLAVAAYLKETGDLSILDEPVPFDNQAGTEAPLYEHLRRSITYTLERLGPHGLPLIGRADWNDCLNLNCFSETPGESFQTTRTARAVRPSRSSLPACSSWLRREMAELADARAEAEEAEHCRTAAAEMTRAVEQHGWDGDLVSACLRLLRAAGRLAGERGGPDLHRAAGHVRDGGDRGAGRPCRAGAGRRSGDRLATPHGIVLLQPAYSRYYLELGEISSYPPGYKENAGIFCHTNPWIMIAEAKIGRGDRALDYYLRINPSARESIRDVHRCEPYVYAQMIAGKDAPTHGEAKNSWLTGTAAWNYVAVTQWILGIRPTLAGLSIQPVIPADWDGFSVVRQFRGVEYRIRVRREGPGNTVSLRVDGQAVPGSVVQLPAQGTTVVNVESVLR